MPAITVSRFLEKSLLEKELRRPEGIAKRVDDLIDESTKAMELTVGEIKERITAATGIMSFKDKSTRTVFVLTDDKDRVALLEKIEKMFKQEGAKYDVNKGASSLGAVVIGHFTIGASPASKQGKGSAGLGNEDAFIDNINQFVEEGPLHIRFKAGSKIFTVKDVVKAEEVGRDTSGRKKSDVNLVTKNGIKVPISLKKDGAEIWESADTYWAAKAKKIVDDLVEKDEVTLSEVTGTIKRISPQVAKKATPAEAKAVVFGSDIIAKKGAVLYRTWRGSDFKVNANENLDVTTTSIYRTQQEVAAGPNQVYFLIRNDSSRRGSKIYPGIRVLAVGKTRINKNVKMVR